MTEINFTTRATPFSFVRNSGGLNSTASQLDVQDNEASDLQSIDFDRFGAFRQRSGSTLLNTAAANSGATCTSLHWFQNKTSDKLIGTFGDQLMKQDDFDGTWDDITNSLTITAGNNNLWTWMTFNNAAYGTNNVDPPIKLDAALTATNFTVPTGLTDARWIENFENFAFLGNVTVSATVRPTRLHWSAIDDAETWDSADFVEIGLDDGEDITGLKKLGDRLVIFKERSIYIALFTGDADIPFFFKKTPSEVGAVSGYSIQEVKNGLVFFAFDGLYFFDGFNSVKLSDRISTTFDGFVASRFDVAVSAYQKSTNKYWLSFTAAGGTEHNRVIIWDTFNNAFSVYAGHDVNAAVVLNTSGEERIYIGNYAGFARRADVSSESSDRSDANAKVAIDCFYKTKFFAFGDVVLQKGIQESVFYHDFANATLTFSYAYDLNDGSDFSQTFNLSDDANLWDTAVWDMATWASEGGTFKRVDHAGRGRLIRLIFANNNVDEEFKINAFGVLAQLETAV